MDKRPKGCSKDFVLRGRFSEDINHLLDMSKKQLDEIVNDINLSESNLCAYSFVCYLLQTNHSSASFNTISTLLIIDFFFLKGAYHCAYHYLKEKMALAPDNFELYEGQLFFYSLPSNVISSYQAREIAKNILRINSESTVAEEARDVISRINRMEEVFNSTTANPTNEQASIIMAHLRQKDVFYPMPAPQDIILAGIQSQINFLILSGRLIEAKKMLLMTDENAFLQTLPLLGRDTRSLCVYTFAWYLMKENETSALHELAAEITKETFRHIEGGHDNIQGIEQAAFFHIRRALELAPDDIRLQEKLLEFYEITLQSFEEGEAQRIVENVLKHHPSSEIAQKVLAALA